jgi:multidrug efflux pump subunit AcrB
MLELGFSINLLTLFGLVVAIGIVVDDAIVVVEAVEHNMAKPNLSARDATFLAMEQFSGPVITVVLVLAAVFLPTVAISGATGQIYKQFAVTIAVSVAISGFVALQVDRAKAEIFGVPIQDVYDAVQTLFGSLSASQYPKCSRVWQVVLQAPRETRRSLFWSLPLADATSKEI